MAAPTKRGKETAPPGDEPAKVAGPNPAEAALAEVSAEDPAAEQEPLKIPFRGAEFPVERDVLTSARFLIAIASGQDHRILFEILGPQQSARFVQLVKRGEPMPAVAAEFLEAVSTAAGWGNSSTS